MTRESELNQAARRCVLKGKLGVVFAAVAMVGGACLLVDWLWPRETSDGVTSVYALCSECGLSREEIDELISAMRAAEGSREKLLESFYATFNPYRQNQGFLNTF